MCLTEVNYFTLIGVFVTCSKLVSSKFPSSYRRADISITRKCLHFLYVHRTLSTCKTPKKIAVLTNGKQINSLR